MNHCGVVIPVHAETDARVRQLHGCLRSLLCQDNYVAVVVDDGSPKDLHLEDIDNPQIRVLRRDKPEGEIKTASCALNVGF